MMIESLLDLDGYAAEDDSKVIDGVRVWQL
jgi:hypothetical protein